MLDNTVQIRYKGVSLAGLAHSPDAVTFDMLVQLLYGCLAPGSLPLPTDSIICARQAVACILGLDKPTTADDDDDAAAADDEMAPPPPLPSPSPSPSAIGDGNVLCVPVRGFTSTWKRTQPFQPAPSAPTVHTQILPSRTALPAGHALHQQRKYRKTEEQTVTETCYLQERRGTFKTVQLCFNRRSLIDPRLVNCPRPIRLYSVAHGGRHADQKASKLRSGRPGGSSGALLGPSHGPGVPGPP
jgi:hypothetical protein